MHIVILVKSSASKKTIKDLCSAHGYGFEFVHSTDELEDALAADPDYLILEAQYGEQDYEDILEELQLHNKLGRSRIILINNSADQLENQSSIYAIVDEYNLLQQLSRHLVAKKSASKRILYVSDDKFMHRVIGDILKKSGYVVLDAFDGFEGLSTYESEEPDLVLTDLDMPGMSGLELCKTIKIQMSDQHTPVIILSGSNFEEDIIAAHTYHAKAYLTKPVPPDKLIRKIDELTH